MDRLKKIADRPEYQQLVRSRRRLAWTLSAIMLTVYFGYILMIAFDKALLARPIGAGVMSIGIPIGFGIILLGVALTAIYVRRANREFDARLDALLEDVPE